MQYLYIIAIIILIILIMIDYRLIEHLFIFILLLLSIYIIDNNKPSQTAIHQIKGGNENTNGKYAFVWLLMLGDSYLPGIIVSCWSVLQTNTKYEIVIMCTNEDKENLLTGVSSEAKEYILSLNKLYPNKVKIVDIDYIITDYDKSIYTEKQIQIYSRWMHLSCTKWRCLSLDYDKVLLLDADTIILDNIDELFQLETPAAPFNNHTYNYSKKDHLSDNQLINHNIKHNTQLNPKFIKYMLNIDCKPSFKFSITASSILLSPNEKIFNQLINEVIGHGKNKNLLGYKMVHNAIDEQTILSLYSVYNNYSWRNIDIRYNFLGHKSKSNLPVKVLHYVSGKPWLLTKEQYNEWHDMRIWCFYAKSLIDKKILTAEDIKLEKMHDIIDNIDVNEFLKGFSFEKYMQQFNI